MTPRDGWSTEIDVTSAAPRQGPTASGTDSFELPLGSPRHPGSQQQPSTESASGLPTLVDIVAVSRSFGISTRQVRRFVANGQIPFVRVGHLVRFDLNALKDWIDARRAGSVG